MANANDVATLLLLGAGAVAAVYELINSSSNTGIKIAETIEEARIQTAELKKRLRHKPMLGFDCEWSAGYPVALLQLATDDGYCVLFRLCRMNIPEELIELLEDGDIIKVGVDPIVDKENLWRDYTINVAGTFDLRFLAVVTGAKPCSLKNMYKSQFGKVLNSDYRISYWEGEKLSHGQIQYAAMDVIAAVELYKTFAQKLYSLKLTGLHQDYNDERFIPHRHNGLQRMDEDGCVVQ